MPNIAAAIANGMQAQGTATPVSLLELQTPNGLRFFFSDMPIVAPSLLAQFDGTDQATGFLTNPDTMGVPLVNIGAAAPSGGGLGIGHIPPTHYIVGTQPDQPATPTYHPWLIDPPQWAFTGLLTTPTSRCVLQNLSGDTVERDFSKYFAAQNLWGSIFIYRLWLPAAEYALITVKGNVTDCQLNDKQVEMQLRGLGNWSEIPAPDCTVDANCGNVFGSQQCGSASATPCQNNYGTCTQKLRFKGVVAQWNGSTTSIANAVGVAQPVPAAAQNLRRSA